MAAECSELHHLSESSDSDGSGRSEKQDHHYRDLSTSIFRSYIETNGRQSSDLSKIQSFLATSSSGSLSCLICLEKIRSSDPVWSCRSSCFAVFHLLCIQGWARQSSDLAAARAVARLPADLFPKAIEESSWNCPKCRIEYSKLSIPKVYICFCGKLENPPTDPWILPHSCGEICGRPLRNNCGHQCLLLCHPGPCPPCPKLVKERCFCGAVEDVRRCEFKAFSCSRLCSRLLDCGLHKCPQACHAGTCPPCRIGSVYPCRCGKIEAERECCSNDFRCDNPCERMLDCGKHVCDKGCHSGSCDKCLLQGMRTCPCGKRVYEGIGCDVIVPLCGETCDKSLNCGFHSCLERCHRGDCNQTCRILMRKSCHCGSLSKEVPCYQHLQCQRKCQKMRDCGRHACRRRCCDGDCAPCSEICGRKLRCKNHKCPAPCHRGPCAPCPVMVTISCSCGETRYEVPCGTEMNQKPPRCARPCSISPLCTHAQYIKSHRCHYGGCPPCTLPCEKKFSCGHICKLRCHGPKPPPKPEFTLKPNKKSNTISAISPGCHCPPCPELVWKSCVGQHIGAERMMTCSDSITFSCENLCGNHLPCGNHYCTKCCHALDGEPCEDCDLPCQKERKSPCSHSCPQPCHPGDCPPCKAVLKRSCHCGCMVHVFECTYFNTLSNSEQITARSCGGKCHRKLPNCTHLCPETCHTGQCAAPDKCPKKVTIRCSCQSLKKERVCEDVQSVYRNSGTDPKDIPRNQFGVGLIPCNSACEAKKKIVLDLQMRKYKPKPMMITEAKLNNEQVPKRRRRDRKHSGEATQSQSSISHRIIASMMKWLMCVVAVMVFYMGACYFYKALLLLSDWMNEVEEKRQRRAG